MILVVSFLAMTSYAQTNAVIKFDKEVYDFGKIKQGVPVNYDFVFKNISKAPLVVETATASCGCTTPTWPQAPVMAGKTNKIKAGFNAAAPGVFEKTITVKIQGVDTPKEIKIKGEVLSEADFAKLKPAPTKVKKSK